MEKLIRIEIVRDFYIEDDFDGIVYFRAGEQYDAEVWYNRFTIIKDDEEYDVVFADYENDSSIKVIE